MKKSWLFDYAKFYLFNTNGRHYHPQIINWVDLIKLRKMVDGL